MAPLTIAAKAAVADIGRAVVKCFKYCVLSSREDFLTMTLRLWRIPSYYPNKHMGVYQDPGPGYADLRFSKGLMLQDEAELSFDFRESKLDKLRALGCLWTNLRIPLLNSQIAEALHENAHGDYQLLKAIAITADGPTNEFSFLNVTNLCECLDYEKSKLQRWEDGSVKAIDRLRLKDDSCMGTRNLTRLAPYKGYILVSEKLFQVLKELKVKGLEFEMDYEGDDYR